jgi:hypothetical protein
MQFPIEKYVSNFVENQFPLFYQEEGPNFILFVKAYYEWMESSGAPIKEARELFNYRDIDNTTIEFLEYFQKKYLYGIPYNVIVNKRLLLKHILDVYRSKGNILCYKLLFRLIYDEDMEIYLPSDDILRISDGNWIQPRYLEVSANPALTDFVGKEIVGISSGVKAIVESYTREPVSSSIVNVLHISNITPPKKDFVIGEKVTLSSDLLGETIADAPVILGSLDHIDVINGGQNFEVGDIVKIVHRDLGTDDTVSRGIDGYLKVTSLTSTYGSLFFSIVKAGTGYSINAMSFTYNSDGDTTGQGASFDLGSIVSVQSVEYNTDLIADYIDVTIDAAAYGFPADAAANSASNIEDAMSHANQIFGSLGSLTNVSTGEDYTLPAFTHVISTQLSDALTGNVSYTTASNTVTGTSTLFTTHFSNNDVVALRANSSLSSSEEYIVIKEVVNSTSMVLWGPPSHNSTASAQYKAAPAVLPSNYAVYEPTMYTVDSSVSGLNGNVGATSSEGNGVIATTAVLNSGKGYVEGESVTLYLTGGLTVPTILAGGVNYENNDVIIFTGGNPSTPALGYVTTDANGSITGTALTEAGSGYDTIPVISIKTSNGTGAVLNVTLTEFNTTSAVTGFVRKAGIGRSKGYWSSTRGFLNADKYIQDSYFYQNFSYQIKVPMILEKYKDVLFNTFHSAGSEMFGLYQLNIKEDMPLSLVHESVHYDITLEV